MNRTIVILLTLLSFASFGQNTQLHDFSQLMDALKTGQAIQAVFHYKDCQLISDNELDDESVDAIGGMVIDTWEYFAKGAIRNKEAFLVASSSKLIQNPKGMGYVYNYVKVKISESGSVKITACYVDAKTMDETMSENFFTDLNDGKKGGAYFYVNQL